MTDDRGECSLLSLLLTATVPVAVVFFLIPFELYYPQRVLWGDEKDLPFFFAAVGICAFILTGVLLWGIHRYRPRIARNASLTLFLFGIYIFLADLFAPLQSSPMNGSELTSGEPLRYTVIECGILVGIVFLVWKVGFDKLLRQAASFSYVVWVLALGYGLLVFTTPKEETVKSAPSPTRSDLKNIYHIILDELQTDAALSVFEDLKLEDELNGFTIFPYNSSSYLFTKSSFPNYMSGTTHPGRGDFSKWHEIFRDTGILKSLGESGYRITMNAPWSTWRNDYTAEYETLDQIMQRSLNMKYPGMGDFFPAWFARLAPNFLANEALHLGVGLEKKLSRKLEDVGRYPRTIGEGRQPFSSVLMLKNAIAREHELPATGRYSYLHAIIPHGPYVMNGDCAFTMRLPQGRVTGYYQQAVCGIRLVVDFIKELQRLGRFDDSIVIVHADTGHGLRGFVHTEGNKIVSSEEDGETEPHERGKFPDWNHRQTVSRTLSFLMVKPAGAKSKVSISDRRSKLTDLHATILDLAGLKSTEKLEGVSVFSKDGTLKDRENRYYLFDPKSNTPDVVTYDWNEGEAMQTIVPLLKRMNLLAVAPNRP